MLDSERVFLALVVANSPHSPGTSGARLAVFESAETHGTIGGGIMEQRVLERARGILRDGGFRPELKQLVHRADAGKNASGLVCAGQQTNLYLLLDPAGDLPVVEKLARHEKAGVAGCFSVTPEGLAFDDASGLPGDAQRNLRQGSGSWHYREQLLNLKRAAILGGGHCGLALSRTLAEVGYHVTVVDNREHLPTMDANDRADRRLVLKDMAAAAGYLDHPELTSLVVMGTDIDMDVRALSGALRLPFPFIGVMGSPAKIKIIRDKLATAGFDHNDWSRVSAPVGLRIGSQTPQEIAISVTAQILKNRSTSGAVNL